MAPRSFNRLMLGLIPDGKRWACDSAINHSNNSGFSGFPPSDWDSCVITGTDSSFYCIFRFHRGSELCLSSASCQLANRSVMVTSRGSEDVCDAVVYHCTCSFFLAQLCNMKTNSFCVLSKICASDWWKMSSESCQLWILLKVHYYITREIKHWRKVSKVIGSLSLALLPATYCTVSQLCSYQHSLSLNTSAD